MKEEMKEMEVSENTGSQISGQKFHRLYGRDLAVALEATFPGDVKIKMLRKFKFPVPALIYPAPEIRCQKEQVRRVYCPAVAEGDMAEQTEGSIIFLPWVDESEVLFHRLVLRLRPGGSEGGKNKKFRWLKFGRFGEDSAFGFNTTTDGTPFINLDFLSQRAEEFVPLYAKVHDGGSGFVCFKISAETCEEAVTLNVRRVTEAEIPPHLAETKPGWFKH